MQTNRKEKSKKRFRYVRWLLLLVLLLIILALLFGGRWGIGSDDLIRLVEQQTSTETEEPADSVSADVQELTVIIEGNNIRIGDESFTLDEIEAYLQEMPEETLVVLHDQEANYALFTSVEEKLNERDLRYVIEE